MLKIVFKNHSNVLIMALSTTSYRGTRTHTHFLTASSPAMYSGTFKSTFAPNMILSYILSLFIILLTNVPFLSIFASVAEE